MVNVEDFGLGSDTDMSGVNDLFKENGTQETSQDIVRLAEQYGKEKRSIKEEEGKLKKRKEKLLKKEAELFAILDCTGIESLSSPEWTFYKRVDTYASVDANMTSKAHDWIKEAGYEDIIRLAVNSRSLTKAVKEIFEETGEVPGEDEGIKVRTVNRVGVRKR